MKTDKKKKMVGFVQEILNKTIDKFNSEKWNENDLFVFACWLFDEYVTTIATKKIVSLDELKERCQKLMKFNIEELFKELKTWDYFSENDINVN